MATLIGGIYTSSSMVLAAKLRNKDVTGMLFQKINTSFVPRILFFVILDYHY